MPPINDTSAIGFGVDSVLTWRAAQEAAKWALADQLAHDLASGLSDRFLAAQTRMSADKVRRWALTATVFPETDRDMDVDFDLYVICAQTDHPQQWLRWVQDHEASAQELRRAIRATTPPTVADWTRRGESLLHQSKRWWRDAPVEAQQTLAPLWALFEAERRHQTHGDE